LLKISHAGAQKMLKRFKKADLTTSKAVGKAIIHKLKLEEDYTKTIISFVLADEANNFNRWKEEFKALSKKERILLIYGSVIKNSKSAEDIDMMVIAKKNEFEKIRKKIKETQEMLPKKIHLIILTKEEFKNNIKNHNKAIAGIIKNAIVLYGQNEYTEEMKHVTGF